jgi:hypothetical protein
MDPVHLYVGLLDVLAYRTRLEQDRSSGRLDFWNDLSAALAVFDQVNESVFSVNAISDTIIVTCLHHESFPEFLRLLRGVFVAFMEQGLFVRGGVAYSRHFQNNRLTYSHGIARAYELESRQAVYPRVVIDENIVNMYEVGEDLPTIQSQSLLCKENGVYFLDILTGDNWHQVYTQAVRIYNENRNALETNEDALGKHLRFERYLLTSRHARSEAVPYIAGIDAH